MYSVRYFDDVTSEFICLVCNKSKLDKIINYYISHHITEDLIAIPVN